MEHHDEGKTIIYEFGVKGGIFYYEVELLTDGPMRIGWASTLRPTTKRGKGNTSKHNHNKNIIGDNAYSIGFDGLHVHHDGVHHEATRKKSTSWKAGDIVGCLLDVGESSNRFYFFLNGYRLCCLEIEIKILFSDLPQFAVVCLSPGQKCQINIGQENFIYPPWNFAFSSFYSFFDSFLTNGSATIRYIFGKEEEEELSFAPTVLLKCIPFKAPVFSIIGSQIGGCPGIPKPKLPAIKSGNNAYSATNNASNNITNTNNYNYGCTVIINSNNVRVKTISNTVRTEPLLGCFRSTYKNLYEKLLPCQTCKNRRNAIGRIFKECPECKKNMSKAPEYRLYKCHVCKDRHKASECLRYECCDTLRICIHCIAGARTIGQCPLHIEALDNDIVSQI